MYSLIAFSTNCPSTSASSSTAFRPSAFFFPASRRCCVFFDLLNDPELKSLWREDETIGWIYQYFNDEAERKKMREESAAPRNSRELAVRNQFFTPRYVVEFLTDNTLGRIWYEMTRGETRLKEQCRYLVRRPNEIFLKPGETAPGAAEAGQPLAGRPAQAARPHPASSAQRPAHHPDARSRLRLDALRPLRLRPLRDHLRRSVGAGGNSSARDALSRPPGMKSSARAPMPTRHAFLGRAPPHHRAQPPRHRH